MFLIIFLLQQSALTGCSTMPIEAVDNIDVMRTLSDEITERIQLSEQQLQQTTADFQAYYVEEVLQRIKEPIKHIVKSAIHPVDINRNGVFELLFWTEGIAPSA